MTEFDKMGEELSIRLRFAADWKNNYYGAAYATRIQAAIADVRLALAAAEAHPEIGLVAQKTIGAL